MSEPFIGSAALAAGTLSRHTLRTRYVAVHHDVYVPKDTEMTAVVRAKAAWLRTRGHGVLAGFSASAVHGARWIDPGRPATVIDTNRRRTRGIEVWAGLIDDDEICVVDGIRVTTPLRTAVDLARRYPLDTAVTAIDALARARRLRVEDIAAATDRPGRHRMKRAREAIALVDPGAESPKETWLRLVIVRAGFPRPETQVPVYNEYGVLIGEVDLGWRDVRIAAEYEGKHHRMSRTAFDKDIRRMDELLEQGWAVLRFTAADTEATVIRRLSAAWNQRMPAAS
ncbi:hypothetical protein ACQI4L_17465 [Mycolicibacterium litorale]|uniref:hypothetical protein n=1 Tax=Mycolicibacterium litorale TaxID=758802 RepID=UPI003CEBF7DE